eukprot:Gb_23324 [translate_table: standard]
MENIGVRLKVGKEVRKFISTSIMNDIALVQEELSFLNPSLVQTDLSEGLRARERHEGREEMTEPTLYRGKRNLHQLAREISDNTSDRLSALEESLLDVRMALAKLKEVV